MSRNKKRIYNTESRDAQAAQTKERILHCAKQLIQAKGFEYVTIEKIANAADVSMPTIYSIYKSKRGILRVLMDEALPTTRFEALVKQARQEKNPKKLLHITARIAREIYDAERAYMGIFQGASVLAPEFKEFEKEREQRRYLRLEGTIKTLVLSRAIKKGLSTSKAHDILWAFTGRDMYRMLVVEQGWSSGVYEAWLVQQLLESLLASDS